MMQVHFGIPVSPGVAIGEAFILDEEQFRIPRHFVNCDAIDVEMQRLDNTLGAVAHELREAEKDVRERMGDEYAAIFSAHLGLLRDARLSDELKSLIRDSRFPPERAISQTFRRYAKLFQEKRDRFFAERANDLLDLERRLLRKLTGFDRDELRNLVAPVIVLAHNLTPSETATLDRRMVLGFATEQGGAGGHTAIVAKGLDMPSVVGVGEFLADVDGGDLMIVDGDRGCVIVGADQDTLLEYQSRAEKHRSQVVRLRELRELPASTLDGKRIEVHANIEFPQETVGCAEFAADGVGLYRTEFLYLERQRDPSEEEQCQAYRHVLETMGSKPVVIRTLDLGADKLGFDQQHEMEPNPFLGLRSIRLTLRNLSLFRTQLRAILRSAVVGAPKIMFPMISTLSELRQAKMALYGAMDDLRDEGIPIPSKLPIGMMIETPASVELLDRFLEEVDFVSVGTNDLVQYVLAVDRSNYNVADLYQCGEPSILRMISRIASIANAKRFPLSVCGQMAATPRYVPLLLGLGMECLSVPPSSIPEIKEVCRRVRISACEEAARRALSLDSAREIDGYLREQLRLWIPEWSLG